MNDQTDNKLTASVKKIFWLAALLTVVAAIPRLYNLGELGFYMDEETTAFASRSMAESGKPRMPSGMPYYRAVSQTWLNSLSVGIFGVEEEISYRLPSALFGILTVPLLFVLARPYVGVPIAFLAALLLAFSEWHIITSRQARMYAPLLFFYIAFAFSVLRWAQNDKLRNIVVSAALFAAAVSFHGLGIFAVFIPLVTLFVAGYSSTPQYKLILFSIVSGLAAYFYSQFVGNPYLAWREAHSIMPATSVAVIDILSILSGNILLIGQGAVGFLLGIWLGRTSKFQDFENAREFRIACRYSLAVLFGCFATTGHLHGAMLAMILLLLLYPGSLFDFLKQAYKPIAAITLLAIIVSLLTMAKSGVIPGVKLLFTFPYPNWGELNGISTGVTLLFIISMLYLAITKKDDDKRAVINLLIIGIFPIILVGVFKKWAAVRYVMEAYPFMLILSAYVLFTFTSVVLKRFSVTKLYPAVCITYVIGLSGILGGHGLLHAYEAGTVRYGDSLNKAAFVFSFYPDHKSPGEFVAAHRKDNDIVIAEDVLTQYWYAGKMDYWLRRYGSESGGVFMYKGDDNKLHDIYVDSVVITSEILSEIERIDSRRIWLITSGEIFGDHDLYLTEEQRLWRMKVESSYKPVFTGKDNVTKVFCLNCETLD